MNSAPMVTVPALRVRLILRGAVLGGMPLPGISLRLSSCAHTGKTADAAMPKINRPALNIEVNAFFNNLA